MSSWVVLAGVALMLAVVTGPARGFDHQDGPAVSADPSTDITDVFAWMSSDATTLNLAMTVSSAADEFSKFSGASAYVFHTGSHTAFGNPPAASVDVICTFAQGSPQATSCWVGGDADYVTGDATATSGVVSASGHVRVFAGLRDDPAFVNVPGLLHFASTVFSAEGSLTFDAAGCPTLNAPTSTALVATLHQDAAGMNPGSNAFAGNNVLALVVSLDVSLLNGGGPIVSVWGSTNQL